MLHDELAELQTIVAMLAAASSEEAIADVVVEWLLPSLGADAVVLALRDGDGGLDVRRAVGYRDQDTRWPRIPLDAGLPLSEAARLGEPIFLSTGAERLAAFPASADIPVQYEGLVALPLRVGTRSLGDAGAELRPIAALRI